MTATIDHPVDHAPESGSGLQRRIVTLRIRRYNPEASDDRARVARVPGRGAPHGPRAGCPRARSSGEQDGTLTFRRSCAHGICGSDAMRINGRNRLACKTLIKDLNMDARHHRGGHQGAPPRKGPRRRHGTLLRGLPRRSALPHHQGHEPTRERLQPAGPSRFDDTTKCILCAACTTSCPVFWTDGQYFGPAAIVNAHRFIFDSRDEGGLAATRHLERPRRRVALPYHLQLHGGLSSRHPDHPGDSGGQARPDLPPGLIATACR